MHTYQDKPVAMWKFIENKIVYYYVEQHFWKQEIPECEVQ